MKTIYFLAGILLVAGGCSKSNDTPAVAAAVPAQPSPKAAIASAPTPAALPTTMPAPPNAPRADALPFREAAALSGAVIQPITAPAAIVAQAAPPPVDAPNPPETSGPARVEAAPAANPPAKSAWERLGRMVSSLTNRTGQAAAGSTNAPITISAADLSTDQIARGLKQALAQGLEHAIGQLGKEGGFLTNANVRIPMPEKLQTVEKLLRRAGQDQMADEFVASMNRAAEKAVPAAAAVFSDSLKQMTVEDARSILQGPKDAATQYFRRTAGPQLEAKFHPIVAEATAQAGATAAYKKLMDNVGFAGAFLKQESLDLDNYVTTKATDGLFKMVAEEERKIRENPVARTTDLLRSVFGALRK